MPGRRFKNAQNYIDEVTVVASLDGDAIKIEGIDHFSIQEIYTVVSASFVTTVQVSNDGSAWVNIGSPNVISATGTNFQNFTNRYEKYLRMQVLRVSGALVNYKAHIHVKSNN